MRIFFYYLNIKVYNNFNHVRTRTIVHSIIQYYVIDISLLFICQIQQIIHFHTHSVNTIYYNYNLNNIFHIDIIALCFTSISAKIITFSHFLNIFHFNKFVGIFFSSTSTSWHCWSRNATWVRFISISFFL